MDKNISLLLHLKLNSLKRNGLDSLTYKQLKKVIYQTKWLISVPDSISRIAKDIDDLTIDEVAKFLTETNDDVSADFEKMTEQFQQESENLERMLSEGSFQLEEESQQD